MTTVLAGMLMPRARVSVANTARTRPAANSSSTTSLNAGSIPAWCAAMPRRRPVQPVAVAEDGQVLRRDVGGAALGDLLDRLGLFGRGQPQARDQALLDGGVAAGPAEDERDRGQQARRSRAATITSGR